MLAASKHNALRDGAIQYGFSLASGLASFLALKLMQHTVADSARYSQLSIILLSFTTFQLITDFGTQTEFIRSYRTADKAKQNSIKVILFKSRLVLGLIALLVSMLYSFSAGFGSEMTQAFLLFQLSFIPFAVMTTSDTIFIAQEKFAKAILARLTRILAIGAFMLPLLFSEGTSLHFSAISFSATMLACCLLTWKFSLEREFSQGSGEFLKNFKTSKVPHENHAQFFRGSFVAASIIAIQLIQALVAQAFLVREIGEKSLTNFNTSIAIATPAILAFQTLSQLHIPTVANWISLSNTSVNEQFYKYSIKIITIFAVMICGLWMAEQTGLARWFFPFSNLEVIKLASMLILAHAILNLGNPTIALCQFRNRVRQFVLVIASALPVSWLIQFFLSRIWPEAALFTGLIFFALFVASASYMALGLHKKSNA